MNSIAGHLASDLKIRQRQLIDAVARRDGRLYLRHEAGEDGPFDRVVVAVPAPQALPLLETAPALQSRVEAVRMRPCWAVMLSFHGPFDPGFDAAFVN